MPNSIGLTPIIDSSLLPNGWYDLSQNQDFLAFYELFFRNSVFNGSAYSSPDLDVEAASIKFQGRLNSLGAGDSSLSGFNLLHLTDEISLPLGGLFLSSGG